MTEVLEPQFVYARDPYSDRVITLCYRVVESTVTEAFMAIVGIAMNRPNEQFSKKIGRKIAQGRMQSGNSLVFIPLKTVRKTERREEILQFIGNDTVDPSWDGLYVDPLIARIMREYLWHRDIEAMIEKGLDRLMGVDCPMPTDPLKALFRETPLPREDYVEPLTY